MNAGINGVLALIIIGSFLAAITFHEAGRALMSFWFSRQVQGMNGQPRVRLRPRLDLLGTTLCVLLAFQPLFPVGLGWGKPLQADSWRMQAAGNAGRSAIAFGGIVCNFIVGLLAAVIFRFTDSFFLGFDTLFAQRILQIVLVFASVNICLALFHLIPLYPLEGFQFVRSLLPEQAASVFVKSANFGWVLILLFFIIIPFLVQLTGGSTIVLFNMPSYLLSASLHLIDDVVGPSPAIRNLVKGLYFS